MKNTRKGFTLVEVLIVVVIIAILASLIVPRMLMQTEKAKAAEAAQIVGVMKRAAERRFDQNSGNAYFYTTFDGKIIGPGGIILSENPLDLIGIEKSKDWSYTYDATSDYWMVQAQRASDGAGLYYVYDPNFVYFGGPQTEVWGCSGPFKDRKDSNGVVIGCTI